ncbi:glycine receptor subunit alpha-3-like [Ixodes scapularis]
MLNGDDIASQIWKPDLTFANVKVARVQEITLPTIMVKIFPDGNITYSIRLNLRLRCLMNLMLYPFDSQRCSILIRSYAHAVEETILRWKQDPLILSYPFELPEFDLVEYFDTSFLRELPAGNFSVLEASFVFERRRGYHFLYGYLPSSLIVCGSWVLLWLKLEIPQAIAALGAVKLLAMVSLASSVRGTIPRVSYVKAIDVWFATCIMFVFALLTVATTAHYLVRVRMRPLCVRRFDHWVGNTYYIWKPDLTFANVKVARVQEITLPTIMVKIFPDGNITYSIR